MIHIVPGGKGGGGVGAMPGGMGGKDGGGLGASSAHSVKPVVDPELSDSQVMVEPACRGTSVGALAEAWYR